MQPYNPYVPPAAIPIGTPAGLTPNRPRGIAIKWVYLTVALAHFVAHLGARLATTPLLKAFAALLGAGLLFLWLGLAGAWIYAAWSDVPREDRGDTTPEGAVVKLIIPFYSFYWIFAVSTGLCAVLNTQLERRGSSPRAPVSLAVFGCIAYLAFSICGLAGLEAARAFVGLLTSAAWFAYMFECDKLRSLIAQDPAA